MTSSSVQAVGRVALALGPLAERVVFVGGAVTPLLVTDPGSAPPRPTLDVDAVVEVASHGAYSQLRDDLLRCGFAEDTEPGAPLCRWRLADLRLDLMPVSADILGFTNRWYPTVVADRRRYEFPGGPSIWLVSGPCFLATKLEAFHDRGQGDHRASHDLEDLLVVVDGRPSIEAEVAVAGEPLRAFLAAEFAALLADVRFVDALPGHLPGDRASQARVPRLKARLEKLAAR